jgi:hypothetical protein
MHLVMDFVSGGFFKDRFDEARELRVIVDDKDFVFLHGMDSLLR